MDINRGVGIRTPTFGPSPTTLVRWLWGGAIFETLR